MSAARPSHGLRKLALALLVTLGLVGISEVGLRLVLAARGRAYSRVAARTHIAEVSASLGAPILPSGELYKTWEDESTSLHPFYAFETSRGAADVAAQATLARGANAAEERTHQAIVMVIGGSVADYFAEYGWSPLRTALAASPALAGRQPLLLRHGRPAFKAPQPLMLFTWLLELGIVPDALVLIDGFNDVALAAYNASLGVHPAYPSIYHWGSLARGLATDRGFDLAVAARGAREQALAFGQDALQRWRGQALRSALYGTWSWRHLDALHELWKSRNQALIDEVAAVATGGRDPVSSGPPFDPSDALALAVDAWERQSLALDSLCKLHGVAFLHVLQPTLHDPGSKPLAPEEIERGEAPQAVISGARDGYPLLRARLAALGARGLSTLDASNAFGGHAEPLYFDLCHFKEAGNALLAAKIAPELERRLARAAVR